MDFCSMVVLAILFWLFMAGLAARKLAGKIGESPLAREATKNIGMAVLEKWLRR